MEDNKKLKNNTKIKKLLADTKKYLPGHNPNSRKGQGYANRIRKRKGKKNVI